MELSLIGLNAAGKTSLVNVIATGNFSEDMIPTVGFNMRKVTKGNVSIKARAPPGRRTACAPSIYHSVCRNMARASPAALGPGWADALSKHVGAILQRSERHCVCALPLEPLSRSRRMCLHHLSVKRMRAASLPAATSRFVVDAADHNNIEIARSELHNLLRKADAKDNPLAGIPLLVRRAPADATLGATLIRE